MSVTQKKTAWMGQNFEKVILACVLIALLISTAILAVNVGRSIRLTEDAGRVGVASPNQGLAGVEARVYDRILQSIRAPFLLSADTNANLLLTSEVRVWCVSEKCLKPIPYASPKCVFCGAEQPLDPDKPGAPRPDADSDGDGIPDEWESKYNLNPHDKADAFVDLDHDAFTNLEEFQEGTNPTDAESYPPYATQLRWANVIRMPFQYRFLGVQKLSDTNQVYQINIRSMERTYFAKIGDVIEGFKVLSYEQKDADEVLILQREKRLVRLVKGKVYDEDELTIVFVFLPDHRADRTKGVYRVRLGETVTVKGQAYKVEEIDGSTVRLKAIAGGRNFKIERVSQDDLMDRTMPSGGLRSGGTAESKGAIRRSGVAPALPRLEAPNAGGAALPPIR